MYMDIKQSRGSALNYIIIGVSALVAIGLIVFAVLQDRQVPAGPVDDGRTGLEDRGEVVLGDVNAPGRIVEFVDFQCSACVSYFANVEQQVREQFIDTGRAYKVTKVLTFIDSYDNYALPRESENAAKAAYCAAEQNLFWEMHDAIFAIEAEELAAGGNENNGNLIDRFFEDVIAQQGGEIEAFESCYASEKADQMIAQHMADAEAAMDGRISTPTVFVNGIRVNPFDLTTYEEALSGESSQELQ